MVVVSPCNTRELHPLNDLIIIGATINIAHANLLPVTTTAGGTIGEQHTILRERLIGKRNRAILAEGIGIEDNRCFTAQGVLHVEDALILQAVIL